MPSPTDPSVTGLVLGAGGSKRLGAPKQLLPYGTHAPGPSCRLDPSLVRPVMVAIGGSALEVRAGVDLAGTEVVVTTPTERVLLVDRGGARLVDPRCESSCDSGRPAGRHGSHGAELVAGGEGTVASAATRTAAATDRVRLRFAIR